MNHPPLLPWFSAGQLHAEESRAIQQHLEVCAQCAEASRRMARIGDDLRAVSGPHIGIQEMIDHQGGQVRDPAHRARIEAHLAACADCTGDLEALRAASPAAVRRAGRPWLAAAAALLLLALAAPAAWRWWSGPVAEGDLWLPTRRSASAAPVLAPPGPWSITLQLPASSPEGAYQARVLNESGREAGTIAAASGADAQGRLRLVIPPLPSSGRFELLVQPVDQAAVSYRYPFETAP